MIQRWTKRCLTRQIESPPGLFSEQPEVTHIPARLTENGLLNVSS
jgi:hypothetical protein